MGDYQHKFIVVIGGYDTISKAKDKAEELGIPTTLSCRLLSNSFWTFYTLPSGSKVGWSNHEEALVKLRQFINWLEEELIVYEFFSFGDYGSFIGKDSLV